MGGVGDVYSVRIDMIKAERNGAERTASNGTERIETSGAERNELKKLAVFGIDMLVKFSEMKIFVPLIEYKLIPCVKSLLD